MLVFECRVLICVFLPIISPVGDLQPPEYPKPRVFRVILSSLRVPTSPSQAVSARRALSYVLRPSASRSVPLSRPFHMPVINPPRSPEEPVPGSPDELSAALAAGASSRLVPKERKRASLRQKVEEGGNLGGGEQRRARKRTEGPIGGVGGAVADGPPIFYFCPSAQCTVHRIYIVVDYRG